MLRTQDMLQHGGLGAGNQTGVNQQPVANILFKNKYLMMYWKKYETQSHNKSMELGPSSLS